MIIFYELTFFLLPIYNDVQIISSKVNNPDYKPLTIKKTN